MSNNQLKNKNDERRNDARNNASIKNACGVKKLPPPKYQINFAARAVEGPQF